MAISNGAMVTIKSGMYKGEWGIVKAFDGEYYHVALWNGSDSLLIFERSEITMKRSIKA